MLRDLLEKRHGYKKDKDTLLDLVIAESEYIHKCTGLKVELREDLNSKDCSMVLLAHNNRVVARVQATRDPIDDLDRLKGLWFHLWQTTSGKGVSA
jgi:hypothetical protein